MRQLECGCEVAPDEVGLCVWHWMAQPCKFCGQRIGKDGHACGIDGSPCCDNCWDERLR